MLLGILLAANFFLMGLPGATGGTTLGYATATLLMALVNLTLAAAWPGLVPPRHDNDHAPRSHLTAAGFTALVACAVLVMAGWSWLHETVIYPIDAQRADMLVVIDHGIRRALQGRNPYTIYHVPWEATLPYGPLMWLPFVAPHLLRIDLRFATIAGELFVPAACALTAVWAAWRGRASAALSALILLMAIAASRELRTFTSIAHTPVYWPLLAACVWLTAQEQWEAAALLCGLLIVARTTMVSIAPVLVLTVWQREPARMPRVVAILAGAAVVPFLPFAVADLGALRYALWGSYQALMKGFVWKDTDWAVHTVGITGFLLRAGWQRWSELVQAGVLIGVYAFSWRAIKRGEQPLPWMALALLAFSMTSLWPVTYIYFDPFLLLVCAGIAELARLPVRTVWGGSLVIAGVTLVAIAAAMLPRNPTIDVGTSTDRPFLYAGFAGDERAGSRTFTWVNGTRAELLVARSSRRDADIELVCQPNLPTEDSTQAMSVALNGSVLGMVPLRGGWQRVSLTAPSRAWQIGVNELVLSFSAAVSPKEMGSGEDSRHLSVAFDEVSVRPR